MARPRQWLPGGLGWDADRFRHALHLGGIQPRVPNRRSCNAPVGYDKRYYRRRGCTEVAAGRSKRRDRVATDRDRPPTAPRAVVVTVTVTVIDPTAIDRATLALGGQ